MLRCLLAFDYFYLLCDNAIRAGAGAKHPAAARAPLPLLFAGEIALPWKTRQIKRPCLNCQGDNRSCSRPAFDSRPAKISKRRAKQRRESNVKPEEQ
jgi:hypothetical protein